MAKWFTYNGLGSVPLTEIPTLSYSEFYADMSQMLRDNTFHCTAYFAMPTSAALQLFAVMLNDNDHTILISSYCVGYNHLEPLESLSKYFAAINPFEREITEEYGVLFADSPWDKPLRFSYSRANQFQNINNYPFYNVNGRSLHQVNVGPIHAGVIEPGVFRFICNGEEVIHLEIVLGYQHRGIEQLMINTDNRLRQAALAESIAGDSAAAHGSAYATLIEGLSSTDSDIKIETERAIAVELERIAMHIADTGALCMDVAYQLGQVACEAIRTVVINSTQRWCGNRFTKGLIRPFGSYYPIDDDIKKMLIENLSEVERRYNKVARNLTTTPSVLARFEDCGTVTTKQAQIIGAVGVAARASALARDIRASHPYGAYTRLEHVPIQYGEGDVMSRLKIRLAEVPQSIQYVRDLLASIDTASSIITPPKYDTLLAINSLSISLVEGWRGEICHIAITDRHGKIQLYKIKDPSMHNWTSLALAVRGEGISDFPICNKSFNLSYCGFDL